MAIVKVLELCRVSPNPSPNIPTSPSLPLTFLDLPWLLFPPSQPLFFFENPTFDSAAMQALRRSLALALGLFYPLAGTLTVTQTPAILCSAEDSVSFAVADSDGDFAFLASDCQRDAGEFRRLVPTLDDDRTRATRGSGALPVFAVQVTIFARAGFSLGFSLHHVVADQRTFNNFMKAWSSLCALDCSSPPSILEPSFDRTVVVDRHGLEGLFLNEWRIRKSSSLPPIMDNDEAVRATLTVGPTEMEKVKRWILTGQSKKGVEAHTLHLSPYVLTCAIIWVCAVKTQGQKGHLATDPNYFGFIAGGLTRVGFSVPQEYFGNCVGFGRAAATRGQLSGEDGFHVAARAIGNAIKGLDKAMLGGAKEWISEWEELIGSGCHVAICGSPKVGLYGLDFGSGRPKKIEEVEIDSTKAISLTESKHVKGGIEIGLVLPKPDMDAFVRQFKECIQTLSSTQHLLS